MNQFFLQLPPKPQIPAIDYHSKIVLLGSCFVKNIGNKLEYFKFQSLVNPFGIIFHPIAIYNLLKRIAEQRLYTENDIFYYNEQWHCFEIHSQLSHADKNKFLKKLNGLLAETKKQLSEATHVVLTYGTAWGYLKNDKIVANCHKVPQQEFTKTLFEVADLEKCFKETFQLIQNLNSNVKIITTISPVRHVKDGIVENNQSKAHLLAAIHKICSENNVASYYPAYELMIDCLRDYRFCKEDLVHPNQTAIDFIWEHFEATWLYETKTQKTLKKVNEIQKGLHHKPFNENSKLHQKFLLNLEEKTNDLNSEFPFMEF